VLRKQHAGGSHVVGADGEQHHAASGGADGHGQAQGFVCQGFFIEVRVVLIAALDFLVAEHHGHLKRGQSVKAAVGYHGLRGAASGHHGAAFEFFGHYFPPPVIISRMSPVV